MESLFIQLNLNFRKWTLTTGLVVQGRREGELSLENESVQEN